MSYIFNQRATRYVFNCNVQVFIIFLCVILIIKLPEIPVDVIFLKVQIFLRTLFTEAIPFGYRNSSTQLLSAIQRKL